MSDQKVFDADVEENKIIAAMSYLWILFLIPLLLKRKSKFAQFHARQGMILFVIDVIASFFIWVPIIGQLLFIVLLIVSIIGIIKAYSGEYWKGPFIYEWSQKIKF